MADNAFLNATEYANSFLLLVKNQLVMGRLVNGQFKNKVTDENGLSINIKRPPRFVAQDGATLQAQPVITGSANVAVDQYKNVHMDVGDLEAIQSYNQLLESQVMKSAASEIAQTIDAEIMDRVKEFASSVGTVGDAIQTSQQFNKAHTRLMDMAVPNESLNAVVSFEDGELIRGALTATNIQGINRNALEKIRIPIISEIDLYASNNIRSVTSGDRTATGATVNGANQNVDYRDTKDTQSQTFLVTGGGTTATYKRGDTFTVADVYAINPRSREVMPYLKQFVVLADATAVTNNVTLTISPPMIVPGTSDGVGTITNTAYATVSAAPANGAAIVFQEAASAITPIKAAFHKSSIALVSARLRTPYTGTSSFVSDPETGIGIRYWRGSDINTGKHIHRWDCVFGVENVDRELGTRVYGTAP